MRGTFLFIAGTEPSETSVRYEKLSSPSNLTYSQNANNLTLSWTSPGTPEAVDINYLTEYFKEGYTIWADEYLQKRLTYNTNKIGNFGFEIYATNGGNSTYLGFTENTSYTVNLNSLSGAYDGFIVKSAYSIFKSNASDGVKILFSDSEDAYQASLSPLSVTLTENDYYSALSTSNVESVKLYSNDIKADIVNLNVRLLSITSSTGSLVSESTVTDMAGTYIAKYEVSFVYSGKTITKTFNQSITVNQKASDSN